MCNISNRLWALLCLLQVSDLENQIDNFEAEVEGLSIKKGKQRPPRLVCSVVFHCKFICSTLHSLLNLFPTISTIDEIILHNQVHLEKSITRHKAHIKKLESILRLLDNDELSPEQVNDVKDFLDDYVERNQVQLSSYVMVTLSSFIYLTRFICAYGRLQSYQGPYVYYDFIQEDFDEFSDVEELYSTLPKEKVEALEDMVSLAASSLVKVGYDADCTYFICDSSDYIEKDNNIMWLLVI
jgi:CCR4-NOT transcription complex subunit 3